MAENDKCSGKDHMTVGPEVSRNQRLFVRHRPDHTIEAGTLQVLKDGDPIDPSGETVRLNHVGPGDLYEVEPLYGSPSQSNGPAQVNSEAYLQGWDRIFGKPVVGKA